MAVTVKEVQEVLEALQNAGGSMTLAELAAVMGRIVNGMSQTLNSKQFAGFITQGDGKGRSRKISLTQEGRKRAAKQQELFSKRS